MPPITNQIDPTPANHLRQSDPVLARIMDSVAPIEYDSSGDVYYDLLSCVADQQIHYRVRIRQAFARLLDLFPGQYPHPAQLLQLPEDEVLAIKLSILKYQTMRRVATHWLDADWAATDWQNLPDETVRERLGSLKGIGPWTIDMILLFTLQRPNILPTGDYQLKKRLLSLYNLPDDKTLPARITALAELWSPYQSLACRYIWAYK